VEVPFAGLGTLDISCEIYQEPSNQEERKDCLTLHSRQRAMRALFLLIV